MEDNNQRACLRANPDYKGRPLLDYVRADKHTNTHAHTGKHSRSGLDDHISYCNKDVNGRAAGISP